MVDFIPTRVSRIKGDAAKEFVSVNYVKPKKRKAETTTDSTENNIEQGAKFSGRDIEQEADNDERRRQELEMKRLRYEVMKFGMSSLKGEEANEANVALAISLGAKPLKRKGINYKILQDQRKGGNEGQQKQGHRSGLKERLTKYKTTQTHKKDSDGILKVYGKLSKKSISKNKK